MQNKNIPLIQHLSNAINSLEKDISHYNWRSPESCNCGIVLQSCLGLTKQELETKYEVEKTKHKYGHNNPTWLTLIQQNCSSTGVPVSGIFSELYSLGFHPEDFTHLEYLNNKAILESIPYEVRIKHMSKNLLIGKSLKII